MLHILHQSHNYNIRAANNNQHDFLQTRTRDYETCSYRKKAAEAWNEIQRMSAPDILNCKVTDFKNELQRLCYNTYYF